MTLRDMLVNYILLAFTDEELANTYFTSAEDLPTLSDADLLDLYDQTMLQAQ